MGYNMSMWQQRKARKALVKIGLDEDYLKDMQSELRKGYKAARSLRDELRKIEAEGYPALVDFLNQISKGDGTFEEKMSESVDLVNGTDLSESERSDLLEQIDMIYGDGSVESQESLMQYAKMNRYRHEMDAFLEKVSANKSLSSKSKFLISKEALGHGILGYIQHQNLLRNIHVQYGIPIPEVDKAQQKSDVEIYLKVVDIIKRTNIASTASFQRELRIGYGTAARIMERLEENHVVGPADGANPRRIY